MKKIKLTQGQFALVDDENFELVNKYNWVIKVASKTLLYAQANVEGKLIKMHKLILKTNKIIDHINNNGLDNRKSNLRIVSTKENAINSRKRKTNTSGKTGVYWDKVRNKWSATITVNYKTIHLGRFSSFEEAKKVRQENELKYFGKLKKESEVFDIKLQGKTKNHFYRKQYNSSNKYKGVNLVNGKYRVRILINGKRTYIGHFNSELDAAKCYIKKFKELYGVNPYEL
jgi:hypothetical protein